MRRMRFHDTRSGFTMAFENSTRFLFYSNYSPSASNILIGGKRHKASPGFPPFPLLIIAKEHLDRQPSIPTNLEPFRNGIQPLNLLLRQLPAIDLEISLDALLGHGLGDDAPALLETPHEEDLLGRAALGGGDVEEGLVGVEGGVCASEAGVARGMDALGGVVGDELGGGIAGMELDLVDGGDDLGPGSVL